MNEPQPIASSTVRAEIIAVADGQRRRRTDTIATEEPLEIRVVLGQARHSISVTMRTPGNDFELAAGFLFSEGIICGRPSIRQISYCTPVGEPQHYNIVNVQLVDDAVFDPQRFTRHVYTTSSCGICGKASLEQVRGALPSRTKTPAPPLPPDNLLLGLPEKVRQGQTVFAKTGGLHAAALFDAKGELVLLREDVGRHNAMDKLIGTLLLKDQLPASESIVLVSGRASFELVQKALMAGIPVLAAVGAPSSLAVALACEFNLTLIGFLRDGRYNLYTGAAK